MISLKSAFSYLGVLAAGIVCGVALIPRKRHYSLYSPQNLARLERGRRIRRAQQLAITAAKTELKRQKFINKLNQL